MNIRKYLSIAALICASGFSAIGQNIIPLYEGKAPGTESWTQKETIYGKEGDRAIAYINDPTIEVFLPEKPNGAAMLVCPGGGFVYLSYDNEGVNVAHRLNEQGITAFVLKYRVNTSMLDKDGKQFAEIGPLAMSFFIDLLFPRRAELAKVHGISPDDAEISEAVATIKECQFAFDDADKAMTLIRANAGKWGLDPHRIGIMGFSAGSIISMHQAMHHTDASRPDFVAPIYTGVSKADMQMPSDPAPLFLCSPMNDIFLPSESIRPMLEWRKSKTPVEHHFFSECGHGFGAGPIGKSVDSWMDLMFGFMKDVNFIK